MLTTELRYQLTYMMHSVNSTDNTRRACSAAFIYHSSVDNNHQLLSRDAMYSAPMPCRSVCLSVCLSVCQITEQKYILELFHLLVAPLF